MEALIEKYTEHLASEKGRTPSDIAIEIDKCIKMVAMKFDVEYRDVYNSFFTEENIQQCLVSQKICNKLTIEECKESCSCFYLPTYGCLPRRLPDADEINDDPDKYVEKKLSKTDDLRRIVEIAAYLYYNYDGGGLTDNSFDALEYHLKKREKIRGRAYEKIGAPPVEKIRVQLPYGMPSLNKARPGTALLSNFLTQFQTKRKYGSVMLPENECIWSLKLDGTSGMVVYKNGKLRGIYTRGDGTLGGDVTYLKDYIKTIPHEVSIDMVVRGEFILTKEVWRTKYEGSYSNARAFVSGKINAGFISPALPDIQFVAHEIMRIEDESKSPKPSFGFKFLDSEGFTVVDHGIFVTPTLFDIVEKYKEKRLSSEYAIDGLVLSINSSRDAVLPLKPGTIVDNPSHTIAFKMLLEAQKRDTKVIGVEWNISRYGRYVPVALYESVYIDGVRLHRASAHNARHIQDWNMGKGTKIVVVRSGDVIPQIKDVEIDPNIVPIFPKSFDDGGYEWHWEKSDIVLDDIDNNSEVQIKRIVYFFETVGVARIRQKTAEKLHESGMIYPEDVVKASVQDFMKIKGIGKKTAETFYKDIRDTLSRIPPDRFIVASTTFKSGVGRKLLKQLFRHIPNILDMSSDEIRMNLTQSKIPGFGPARIKSVSDSIPKFREYLDSFASEDVKKSAKYYVNKAKELERAGYNLLIKDKKFVLTGFMGKVDYELEDYIYDNQGDFAAVVTSDVEAVITGNVTDLSTKMEAASKLGIPVLTLQEFSERYDVPLKRFAEEEN